MSLRRLLPPLALYREHQDGELAIFGLALGEVATRRRKGSRLVGLEGGGEAIGEMAEGLAVRDTDHDALVFLECG